MASTSRCPPWVEENPHQKRLVNESRKYSRLLTTNMVRLCRTVVMVGLWMYLIAVGVIDTSTEHNLKKLGTNEAQVQGLLEYLLKNPCWKLHAFVKALCMNNQDHVVSQILLLNHKEYVDAQQDQQYTSHSILLTKEIKAHRDVYHRTLMQGRLFDIPSLDLPYDTEPCFIQVLATSDGLMRNPEKISSVDILKAKPGKPRVRTALLSGPPGAGKSSFIRYYVYKWCQTEDGQSDWDLIIIVNISTLRLTPGLSSKDHIKEAIRQSLEGAGDKEAIMRSLDDDSMNILIIPEGMDECRSAPVLEMLDKLIYSCYRGELGFTVLSTCRSGLSQIKYSLFDRCLKIDGFTRKQGIEYVERFYTEIQKPEDDSIYDYITGSQKELDQILTNPLCVHILCVVTADGTLKLRKGQKLRIKELFVAMEESMKKRQLEKNEAIKNVLTKQQLKDQTTQFYNMSLYALLKDVRIFTQSLLDKFQISDQNPYLTFLHKKKTYHMYQQSEEASQWTYNHEMFHEYFSASALEALPKDLSSAIFLTISSDSKFRNTQRILFSAMGGDVDHLVTLADMLRVNLITQAKFNELGNELINGLEKFKKRCSTSVDLDEILNSLVPGKDMTLETSKVKTVWQRIKNVYENGAELLQTSGILFEIQMKKNEYLLNHIYDCLAEVAEKHQQQVFDQSLGCYLPSIRLDGDGDPVQHRRREVVRGY